MSIRLSFACVLLIVVGCGRGEQPPAVAPPVAATAKDTAAERKQLTFAFLRAIRDEQLVVVMNRNSNFLEEMVKKSSANLDQREKLGVLSKQVSDVGYREVKRLPLTDDFSIAVGRIFFKLDGGEALTEKEAAMLRQHGSSFLIVLKHTDEGKSPFAHRMKALKTIGDQLRQEQVNGSKILAAQEAVMRLPIDEAKSTETGKAIEAALKSYSPFPEASVLYCAMLSGLLQDHRGAMKSSDAAKSSGANSGGSLVARAIALHGLGQRKEAETMFQQGVAANKSFASFRGLVE